MSLYEWLLFLHVLAAFLLVAGLAAYGVLVLGSGGEATRRALDAPAMALWNVGGLGVLVLGIWLALHVDGYELWDAWIVAAIVLWLIASGAGGRLSRRRARGRPRPGARAARGHGPGHVRAAHRHDLQAGRLMFAIVRPDSWNLPLFVHVAGAMLLVAAVVVVLAVTAGALRRGDDAAVLMRLAFRALLLGVLPAWLVMRVGAQWVASEEAVGDPSWIGIGYGDLGGRAAADPDRDGAGVARDAPRRRPARAGPSSCSRRCCSSPSRSRSGR